MDKLIAFGILSIPIIFLSWRTLFQVKSHGFYRFFSWECILWLFIADLKFWFSDPFCLRQIISWIFLFLSVYLVIAGVMMLNKSGKPDSGRDEKTLFQFEKTSGLVDLGIYKYIRHPLYSSLLFLTWGIFLKQPANLLFVVATLSSLFLYTTALFDEKECLAFFGEQYNSYMKRTKRFIPFVF